MIRSIKPADINQIKDIYNYYVLNSIITFEEEPVSAEKMSNSLKTTIPDVPCIVFEENQKILGYAYAGVWKARSGYRYTAELSVYLIPDALNKGIGTLFYNELIDKLKKMNFHAIIGGITLPNDGSVALHEKFGFEKVAHYKETGFKFNQWIDVGYWELLINKK